MTEGKTATSSLIGHNLAWLVNGFHKARLDADPRCTSPSAARYRYEDMGLWFEYYPDGQGVDFIGDNWLLTTDWSDNFKVIREEFDVDAEDCLNTLTMLRIAMSG